jgi:membrane protein implicated in regulation of membrane protease activity
MLVAGGLVLLIVLHIVSGPLGLALIVCALVFEIAEKAFWARYLRRIPVAVGAEAMIGRPVTAVSDCRPLGRVRYGPESWLARCSEGATLGETLLIDSVENITLIVHQPRR